MSQEITIELYNSLKKKLEVTNNKISQLEVEKKYKQEQLKNILSKYNLKSISELKSLVETKKIESNKVISELTQKLQETAESMSVLDSVLHS